MPAVYQQLLGSPIIALTLLLPNKEKMNQILHGMHTWRDVAVGMSEKLELGRGQPRKIWRKDGQWAYNECMRERGMVVRRRGRGRESER